MINKIKKSVLDLCSQTKWSWTEHITSVVNNSLLLAEKLDADKEALELAAWLHDITKIQAEAKAPESPEKFKKVWPLHYKTGAVEAEKILRSFNYPDEKIAKVRSIILTHSMRDSHVPETKEQKILAAADAMSHFDNFLARAYGVYAEDKLSIEQGRQSLTKKYNKYWNKLIPEAKELVKEKYDKIKFILGISS